tara:strand:- start:1073 stop:1486 length:414 start_codon:yes stop_codon:yes gene_type:complete
MGLDMYAYRHKGEVYKNPREVRGEETRPQFEEIAYWRKHNRLQGFMENKFNKRHDGKQLEWNSFNCVPLYLTKEDLDELEKAVKSRQLPETNGFFFGQDSYTWEGEQEDMKAYDLEFVKKAKESLEQGYKVFYECWW